MTGQFEQVQVGENFYIPSLPVEPQAVGPSQTPDSDSSCQHILNSIKINHAETDQATRHKLEIKRNSSLQANATPVKEPRPAHDQGVSLPFPGLDVTPL